MGIDVSIIIPYNIDRGFLKSAIYSSRHQAFTGKFEVIIQHGNFSVSKNINDALKKAKGKYIKLCAEDDILFLNCLHFLFNKAESGNYDLVCANAINKGDFKEYTVKSSIPEKVCDLAFQNTIHGLTVLFKRKSLPDFCEDLCTGEEYDIYLKMASNGCKFGYVDETVGVYRLHELQKSGVYCNPNIESVSKRREYLHEKIRRFYIENQNIINK